MPGYGKSEGSIYSWGLQKILDENGPAEVIFEIINKFELKVPVFYGYDWGGTIVLKLSSYR